MTVSQSGQGTTPMIPTAPTAVPPVDQRLLRRATVLLLSGLAALVVAPFAGFFAFVWALSDPSGAPPTASDKLLDWLAGVALFGVPVLVIGGVVLFVLGIVRYRLARRNVAWVYQAPPGWPAELPNLAGKATGDELAGAGPAGRMAGAAAGPWPYPPNVPDPPDGWRFWRAERVAGKRGRRTDEPAS